MRAIAGSLLVSGLARRSNHRVAMARLLGSGRGDSDGGNSGGGEGEGGPAGVSRGQGTEGLVGQARLILFASRGNVSQLPRSHAMHVASKYPALSDGPA